MDDSWTISLSASGANMSLTSRNYSAPPAGIGPATFGLGKRGANIKRALSFVQLRWPQTASSTHRP
jgi:hypothetical protein